MTTVPDANTLVNFTSENYGLQLGIQILHSFTNGIKDGDVLLVSDNGSLIAHQARFC